jgi:hypothetical protein
MSFLAQANMTNEKKNGTCAKFDNLKMWTHLQKKFKNYDKSKNQIKFLSSINEKIQYLS